MCWEGRRSVADVSRVYDERKPLEPKYPSTTPSIADFVIEQNAKDGVKSINGEGAYNSEEEELRFAPPG